MTLLATSKVDVPVNLGAAHAQYPTKPSGPTYPSRPKSKLCKNPAPAGTRHPTPGTLLKKFPGFCPKKKEVCISPSCSSCHPVRLKNQDSKTTRTEKYKLLNLVEMKVCISGLTLTQNPNPQKNTNFLKGLGFRVRVRPEKQTLDFGETRVCFSDPPHPGQPTPSKMIRYRSEGWFTWGGVAYKSKLWIWGKTRTFFK